MDRDNQSMTVQGDSAWGPPIHLMELLAKEFDLKILMSLRKRSFGGYNKYDKTGILEEHSVSYDELNLAMPHTFSSLSTMLKMITMRTYEMLLIVITNTCKGRPC